MTNFIRVFAPLAAVFFAFACTEKSNEPGPAPSDAGVVHDGGSERDGGPDPSEFEWPVETGPITITPSDAWKNRISAPDDEFRNPARDVGDEIRWVKFAVLMRDPSKVYFQDGRVYAYHYDFASAHLDPFVGLTRAELDAQSLHEEGQEVIFGAVLFPPSPDVEELGVQLVRQDAYHPEMVRIVFDLVVASIDASENTQPFYMPTFEQQASADQWRGWLSDRGVEVSSVSRWGTSLPCYAPGWAVGKLVRVEAEQIDEAYRTGALTAEDILLTNAVPAEIPFVAGVLSESPSTPNSHVAILARSYGVPFAQIDEVPAALVGKTVAVAAYDAFTGTCDVEVTDIDALDPAMLAALRALKAPPPLTIPAKQSLGAISGSVDDLDDSDIVYFGGKAANFGLLRDVVPDDSPQAVALSFDLWDAFLAQTLPTNKTLAQEIDDRLAGVTFPPNVAELDVKLDEIRTLIEDASFTAEQRTAIAAALAPFDPAKKIRFRSSTNVEDSDVFSGAGLYDSYSGCLADDTDADEEGPSQCDAERAKERGVYRAIKKVYASFYNDNAFMERLRHGVDESQVAMGVLVHHSFPDAIELANGVVVMDHDSPTWITAQIVSQPGAVSVTNPETGAPPEVMNAYLPNQGDPSLVLREPSSLVTLGTTVLEDPNEYFALLDLTRRVTDAYASRHPSLDSFLLDFEYKKIEPGDLVLKQVRRIPQTRPNTTTPAFLLGSSVELCTFQGEYGDVFSMHRGKSRWTIETTASWLDEASLDAGIFGRVAVEHLRDRSRVQSDGDLRTFPGATHTIDGTTLVESYADDEMSGARTFSIETHTVREVEDWRSPLFTYDDFSKYVWIDYATPKPLVDWMGSTTTTQDVINLQPCTGPDDLTPAHILHEEDIDGPNGVTVNTRLYWPPNPTGAIAGYTAPLIAWDATTITGLTTNPIVLRGWWSQTYRPEHHNFGSNFIFDPWLEEGIDSATLDELTTLDIRYLYIAPDRTFYAVGLDGTLRTL